MSRLSPQDPVSRELVEAAFVCDFVRVRELLAEGIGPARRTDRRPTFAGIYRLDHVFARLPDGLDLRMHRLDRSYGSDHFPLAGVLAD